MDDLFLPSGKKTFSPIKFNFTYLIFFFLFILLLTIFNFLNFQFFYKSRAKEILESSNYLTFFYFPPRGRIYDRNGKILADSKKSYDIYAHLKNLENHEKEILEEIIKKENPLYFYWGDEIIIRFLDLDKVNKILARKEDYPHIFIIPSYKRVYYVKEGWGNVLGYVALSEKNSLEFEGKEGIEAYYDEILKGKLGKIVFKKTKNGLVKVYEEEPISGQDIYLTIDKDFQEKVYEEIKNYFEENGYKNGAFILTDPRNGEVLAFISYPSFDPNTLLERKEEFAKILNDPRKPFFNRVVSGLYLPGSTIKTIIASAALEEKIVTPQTKIYSSGELKIPHPYFPGVYSIFKDNKVHGWTDVYKAISDSVNIYFYAVGGGYPYPSEEIPIKKGLGIEKINFYFRKFGLGEKTGIDFPGEKMGLLPLDKNKDLSSWRLGDTYNVSIGQGNLSATLLQINLWNCYFAYGKIYKPFLVKKIVSLEKNKKEEKTPKILRENIISQESLEVVRKGMRMTVTQGTAKILNDLPFSLAGKSGSPQVLGKQKLNAIFSGFGPYEKPQFCATLLIEEVPYGSVASLPLFKKIMYIYYEKFLENGRNSF